ncbi:MAG: hypothetical protein IJY20_03665 [Clostridia bacterium]|nr:hypothetical protein [Clostridia bacterium]
MKRYTCFRRVLALLLLTLMLVAMPGCSKYRVEMSNSRQSETMLTLGETTVAYEVVYFFYHTYLEAYPTESFDARMARVKSGVCELYAIFDVCRDYGIDPYGETVNDALNETVKEMIDEFPTRRDYIDRITEQHMTDTVSRLLLRSYLCQEMLMEELEGELENDAVLDAFLAREDVLRVLSLTLNFGTQTEAMRRRAEEIVALLAEAEDTDEAFMEIARRKATMEDEHTYITVSQWYSLCGEGAPAPEKGTISAPLYEGETCVMMRVSDKDADYARAHRDEITPGYLECLIADRAAELAAALQQTAAYDALTEDSFA